MKNRDELFSVIKKIMRDNSITVSAMARISGINRSTLQKALVCERPMNLRQFNMLVCSLPITEGERRELYRSFAKLTLENGRYDCDQYVLDILGTISDKLANLGVPEFRPILTEMESLKSYYSGEAVVHILRMLTAREITTSDKPQICMYAPLGNSFCMDNVLSIAQTGDENIHISVLFEMLKSAQDQQLNSLKTFKNLIPMVLDKYDRFELHYVYVKEYIYDNHLAVYPYYVLFSDVAVLLNHRLNRMAVIEDEDVVRDMRDIHLQNAQNANSLKSTYSDFKESVKLLADNHIYDESMCSMLYEPQLLGYVPYEMYDRIVNDETGDKAEFIAILKDVMDRINSIEARRFIFNKTGIEDFVKSGNVVGFKHPLLNCCTVSERIVVLNELLKSVRNKNNVIRAFTSNNINISRHYSLSDVQSSFNLQLAIYPNDECVKVITIHEPVICRCFANFFEDVVETDRVFTLEETVELIEAAIDELKMKM
jgi:hypothetical protein